jgi:arogenate dehydrogenase (NADP+)
MFGPDSGKGSWRGLNFMYEVVRVGGDAGRMARIENLLRVSAGLHSVKPG